MLDFFRYLIQVLLHLIFTPKIKMSNSLSVYIKSSVGNTLSVELDPKWDIRNLKEKIAPKLGLSPDDVKIIFAGKELMDCIVIEECDLGQQSILHAVKIRHIDKKQQNGDESDVEGSRPMNETLVDWQLTANERNNLEKNNDPEHGRAHFYVYCSHPCKKLRPGKLRVRCATCSSGAFTVDRDPQCWDDVLKEQKISGTCEECPEEGAPQFAKFFFKCSEHASQGEHEETVPLDLVKTNIRDVPCLACTEIKNPVLVFPCHEGHVTCLDCFQAYCISRLRDRQFWSHPELGYTLPCPAGCADSLIQEVHHFHLLTDEQYAMYQRFGAEEFVLQAGGVLCPQPGCGMGILAPEGCRKIHCAHGCEFVFCRQCRQGYHLGECSDVETDDTGQLGSNCQYNVDPVRASQARWDEATKAAIRVTTKPCPKCRTPTERSGGCMHMICTRPQCGFHWCWVCQTEWTRDCMGSHWFG
ncbi:E3 ubiquitin-protein ligase parkin-like [Thrips palmi]|uniref:E3 ubiquitin-protein ligase parkin n=1 Tax=Thrips palmi TaxID=161013 RepID=A0A6P9A254_THRPL|nr:E3 ubiquitin-protein ligase parkin-like [Thrips palmi]